MVYDIRLTVRIPAKTAGMVLVRLAVGEKARWSLSRSGKLSLLGDPTGAAEPGPLPLEELSLTEQELGLSWQATDQERRIRLDCGVTTDGPELKLSLTKDARVSATIASGIREESTRGNAVGFSVHDHVQSPLEQLPSGPPVVGMLSLPTTRDVSE